ncbi:glycosyltransferase family 4 protein [Roseibium aggregatum]|nr:glycosyltransferase family 4 protein [Roseibium aggregatum]
MNANPPMMTHVEGAEGLEDFRDVHLLHVVRQYAPMVGGLEDFVRNLVARQKGRFASVRVLTLDRLFIDPDRRLPEDVILDGIPVHRIPFYGSSRYPVAPAVFSSLGEAGLIHVHAVDFFFDALALTKPFHRRKLVATTHGGFFHTEQSRGLKKVWLNTMTRLSSRFYDGIACCSENDLAMFRRLAPSRTRLIENGVDLSKFHDASAPAPEKRIVTIGRFSANKRLDRTLDALQYLVRTDPAWQLDIIGSPSDLSVADLEDLTAARGLERHVHLHLGLSDEQVRDVLSASSIFVSASEYEGFGIALIEALSAGLIPVVQPNTAFRSLAERHPMVHLADFADPEQAAGTITHAMAELVRDPVTRQSAIVSAGQHGWTAAAAAYDALYRSVLG